MDLPGRKGNLYPGCQGPTLTGIAESQLPNWLTKGDYEACTDQPSAEDWGCFGQGVPPDREIIPARRIQYDLKVEENLRVIKPSLFATDRPRLDILPLIVLALLLFALYKYLRN